MSTLLALAWMAGLLAVLLCLTFIAFAVVKMMVLARVKPVTAVAPEVKGLAAGVHGANLSAIKETLESMAKLTDSLAKAPLPVVAIVTAIVFMMLAILAAYLGRAPAAPPKPEAPAGTAFVPGDRCIVSGFASGDHRLPAALKDAPAGCFAALAKQLQTQELGSLLIVGRVDIRELNPKTRERYTENFTLAYQRGTAVRTQLFTATASPPRLAKNAERALVMSAGAQATGDRLPTEVLASDRVVELLPFWVVEEKTRS